MEPVKDSLADLTGCSAAKSGEFISTLIANASALGATGALDGDIAGKLSRSLNP